MEHAEIGAVIQRSLPPEEGQEYAAFCEKTKEAYIVAAKRLALSAHKSIEAVLSAALTLSSAPEANLGFERHFGYYLVGLGRRRLQGALNCKITWCNRFTQCVENAGPRCYIILSAIIASTIVATFIAFVVTHAVRLVSWSTVLILLAAVPLSLWVSFLLSQSALLVLIKPRYLCRYDFIDGIPATFKVAVVFPIIINNHADVEEATATLEANLARNAGANVVFCLLTDFADATMQTVSSDSYLIEKLDIEIRMIVSRHPEYAKSIVLLHRDRTLNAVDGLWMGWERKRGKLLEFGRLLRGDLRGNFTLRHGEWFSLRDVRFVLTLDAGSVLQPDGVRTLSGILAHPLNLPVIRENRVVSGFAIISPRSAAARPLLRSPFSRIMYGKAVIEAVSVEIKAFHNDCLGRHLYGGCGIYDVNAFQQCVDGRLPENAILSHDHLEGMLASTASADVFVFEAFPENPLTWRKRQHRWIRGDFQVSPWLFRRYGNTEGVRMPFSLAVIDRVLILTNLVVHIAPLSVLVIAMYAWMGALRRGGNVVALVALVVLYTPSLLASVSMSAHLRNEKRSESGGLYLLHYWRRRLRAAGATILYGAGNWWLSVVLLADYACLASDAIVRASYRMNVSRKDLLEWSTSSSVARSTKTDVLSYWMQMLKAPGLAVMLLILVWLVAPANVVCAAPWFCAWASSPIIAYWLGKPLVGRPRNSRNIGSRRR